ncbi:hypothetical protein CIHG_03111 [Coccidioides immitis H538.4]|uniref:Uncharacterized protein n=2 Tax=Coccidioides immitis TaxID=5501 RepID=A0A0J8R3F6_COCIT|nr:hypothetical protein CISG_07058 [Coccidioides immitis RMSCC 3703]KMU85327.1 hypothetical protein CIHG_03111 [Coccidioides immitis H538.4]
MKTFFFFFSLLSCGSSMVVHSDCMTKGHPPGDIIPLRKVAMAIRVFAYQGWAKRQQTTADSQSRFSNLSDLQSAMLSALRGSGLGKFTHLNSLIWSPQAASGCGVGTNPQSEACKGYADKRMDR